MLYGKKSKSLDFGVRVQGPSADSTGISSVTSD